MNIPQNLKYTQDDEWVRVEGEFAYVGITDYAQHELGDIVFVDVDCVGDTIEGGEAFGSLEAVKTVADLEREENFPNVDALKHWAAYNLNETERRASLNFDTFTPLQAGLAKYSVHLLYENRYNIHYNALVNYCRTLDDKKFASGLTGEQLEQKINSLAQEANHSTRVNTLIDGLLNFVESEL